MSRSTTFVATALVGGTLLLSACAEPPTESIDAAVQAHEAASAAGAEEYAPASFARMAEVRAELDAEMTAQQSRLALRRSYDRTEELAAALKSASDEAANESSSAKESVRVEATDLIAAVRLAHGEATAALATAPAAKGSSADLAALRTDLETANAALGEAEAALQSQEYMDAKTKALAAQELVTRVKDAVAAARGMRIS